MIKEIKPLKKAPIRDLLPDYSDLPTAFTKWGARKNNEWVAIMEKWFHCGLPGDTAFIVKEKIDCGAAIKHINNILRSWEIDYEYKIAGCAYLLSVWFEEINY